MTEPEDEAPEQPEPQPEQAQPESGNDYVFWGTLILLVVGTVALASWEGLRPRRPRHGWGNESAAIGALKMIGTSQSLFREGDKDGDTTLDYGSLTELSQQSLVDSVLGAGTKQGYTFSASYHPQTPEFLWWGIANPAVPGTTGDRYFATNHEGVTYYTTTNAITPEMFGNDLQIPKGMVPVGK